MFSSGSQLPEASRLMNTHSRGAARALYPQVGSGKHSINSAAQLPLPVLAALVNWSQLFA